MISMVLTRLRIWGSAVRIRSGAPFAYKTTNIPVRGLFAGNDSLQHVLAANNPDGLVVDLDGVDDRADVGPARIGIAVVQLLGHEACKGVDLGLVDCRYRAALRTGPIERSLGALAFELQGCGAFPENIVKLDDAI